jgi:hypothetical protein
VEAPKKVEKKEKKEGEEEVVQEEPKKEVKTKSVTQSQKIKFKNSVMNELSTE